MRGITKGLARLCLDAIEKLPRPRLAFGRYFSPEKSCYCAVGAIWRNGLPFGNYDPKLIYTLPTEQFDALTDLNDADYSETPEERYIRVHAALTEIVNG
jgi:hypothetical protein